MPDGTATAHLYRPKLVTALHEGYSLNAFRRDLLAALTVAIVALPLSMAIAVASGVSPERGLYTSIIGGFAVSALGGSRFQIGGPAGAFIVLVAATVAKFGIEGLLLTVLISGALLTLIGALRLGSLIRHIPHPVTVGFTAGIAVTIPGKPTQGSRRFQAHGAGAGRTDPETDRTGARAADAEFRGPGRRCRLGGVDLSDSALSAELARHADRRGGCVGHRGSGASAGRDDRDAIWRAAARPLAAGATEGLVQLVVEVLPAALSFTLLGGIESLLSAKVADSMTGRKHRANMELVAQGIANMASALFGGISVTGTIARTATNIRAGARSPLSGSCMRASCCCSCWWRRRWPASCHSRRWRVFLSSSAGIWRRRPSLPASCVNGSLPPFYSPPSG